MSNAANKLIQAAAGNAGEAVYVEDVFSTFLYEGTGSNQTITNNIDLNGEGGLVWLKDRNNAYDHALYDTERGVYKYLESNQTGAEVSNTTHLRAFNSNGFDIGVNLQINTSGSDYVSWTFRKQEGFFDVVTYTGDGVAGRTVNHNLGSVPGFMVVKKLNSTSDWTTYHRSMGATKYAPLNDTDVYSTGSAIWNNTEPTATQFTVGDNSRMNGNGDTFVAYLFAHDEQDFGTDSDEAIIKCGNYTGSGSTGKFVDLGFEPQWVLVKNTDAGTPWVLIDTMRGMVVDGDGVRLLANQDVAEVSSASYFAPRPTGMEVTQQNTYVNTSGQNYVYMAIRRPHKPASEFAATDLYSPLSAQPITGGIFNHTHLADFSFYKYTAGSQNWAVQDRLRGPKDLSSNSTAAENGLVGGNAWDRMEGYINQNPGAGNYSSWAWRRAPGYFDVVTYTGTGSAHAENHGLGVVPEMIWVKERNGATNWNVYSKTSGATKYLLLNATQGENTWAGYWNDTTPTSTQFTVGTDASNNSSGDNYIAYLFASVPGISKVGSYTGTGSDLNVDCGFSAGARFVLIKRTDATGDWYVYDSVQGIVAGNDPYLLLNTTAAQVTGTDYIDPLSSGFTVTSSAPTGLNASSGTYLFYAIA